MMLEKKVSKLEGTVMILEKKASEFAEELKLHQYLCTDLAQDNQQSLDRNLAHAFDCVASFFLRGKHLKTQAFIVAESILNGSMTGAALGCDHLHKIIKAEVKETFKPR